MVLLPSHVFLPIELHLLCSNYLTVLSQHRKQRDSW